MRDLTCQLGLMILAASNGSGNGSKICHSGTVRHIDLKSGKECRGSSRS